MAASFDTRLPTPGASNPAADTPPNADISTLRAALVLVLDNWKDSYLKENPKIFQSASIEKCWGTGHIAMVNEAIARILDCFDKRNTSLNLALSAEEKETKEEIVYRNGPDAWVRGKHFKYGSIQRPLDLFSLPDLSSLTHVTRLDLNAARSHGYQMQLHSLNFSLLPPNLEELVFGSGFITTISGAVPPSLTRLYVNKNPITQIPPELLKPSNLRDITISKCAIKEIPDEFYRAHPDLNSLNLDSNNLTDFKPLKGTLLKLINLEINYQKNKCLDIKWDPPKLPSASSKV